MEMTTVHKIQKELKLMAKKEIRQRMIFMCDLPIGDGSEFSGLHPVLIGSVDLRNKNSPNVYIFPITHAIKKYQPTHVRICKADYDFLKYESSTILCESGREISRSRIQRFIGEISEDDFYKVLECKEYIFKEKC